MTGDPTRDFIEAVRSALATYDKAQALAQDPAHGIPFVSVVVTYLNGAELIGLQARVRMHRSGEAWDVYSAPGAVVTVATSVVNAITKGLSYLDDEQRVLVTAHRLGLLIGDLVAKVVSPSLGPEGVR